MLKHFTTSIRITLLPIQAPGDGYRWQQPEWDLAWRERSRTRASILLERGQGPQPSDGPTAGPGEGGLGAGEGGDPVACRVPPTVVRDLT